MKIASIQVENYRCILDATLPCERLTALVGANGTGKSSFLRAIELFAATAPKMTEDDFYNRDTTAEVRITLRLSDLSSSAQDLFSAYVNDGSLTVTRTFRLIDGKVIAKYYGMRLQIPEFAPVRGSSAVAEAKKVYDDLRAHTDFAGLPAWRSRDQAAQAMADWELQHPDRCQLLTEENQFFGFAEVATGYLGRFIRFIFIPAVRDASLDATEGKGSPISELMDAAVRKTLAAREDVKSFWYDTQQRYSDLMNIEQIPDLERLRGNLNLSLKTYLPAANLHIDWSTLPTLQLPLPQAEVKIEEDGYAAPVSKTGHGTQRAFILSVLQQLAVSASEGMPGIQDQAKDGIPDDLPTMVLVIEEPELYQHPNRQRTFARTLLKLAEGEIPGVAHTVQVVYGTHCPHFVGVDRFHQVRVLRKLSRGEDQPRATSVRQAEGQVVAHKLQQVLQACGSYPDRGPNFTWETLRPRLQTIMSQHVNEGFFADVVVLVEGELDRAAIIATAYFLDIDLESMGVSVIACGGKPSLDRPLLIFREFGIPVYTVWDGDKGTKGAPARENHLLLRLHDVPPEDWPATQVKSTFACFEKNLESTLKHELTQSTYEEICQLCSEEFSISAAAGGLKHVAFFEAMLRHSSTYGKVPATLREIVLSVASMSASLDSVV